MRKRIIYLLIVLGMFFLGGCSDSNQREELISFEVLSFNYDEGNNEINYTLEVSNNYDTDIYIREMEVVFTPEFKEKMLQPSKSEKIYTSSGDSSEVEGKVLLKSKITEQEANDFMKNLINVKADINIEDVFSLGDSRPDSFDNQRKMLD